MNKEEAKEHLEKLRRDGPIHMWFMNGMIDDDGTLRISVNRLRCLRVCSVYIFLSLIYSCQF